MIVSINQPAYLPWLGYFERIAKSDIHIILDHVQFEKNSMTNRNKVRTNQGWAWLTVPVASKGKFGDLKINELEISSNIRWQKKHWNTIKGSYSKAPFFTDYAGEIEAIYAKEWNKLDPLMTELTQFFIEQLAISTKIVKSRDLNPTKNKSELILELCQKVEADTYLSGFFGKDYLDIGQFDEHGIEVLFQDYQHPVYHQMQGEFMPYMSIIDLLFNEGPNSLDVLMGGSTK